jgi:hypothetical protein
MNSDVVFVKANMTKKNYVSYIRVLYLKEKLASSMVEKVAAISVYQLSSILVTSSASSLVSTCLTLEATIPGVQSSPWDR